MIILCNWKRVFCARCAWVVAPPPLCAAPRRHFVLIPNPGFVNVRIFEALKAKNNQNMGPTCDSVRHQFDLLQINQITSTHCCNMSATTCLPGISVNVENTTARWCVVCGKRTNIGQNTSCVPVYALALLTLLPWIIFLSSSHKTKYYNLVPPNIQGGHIWQVSTHGPSVHIISVFNSDRIHYNTRS